MSVGMMVPITVLRAIRFYLAAPRGTMPGIGEALRLTLVSSAANVFLPAKSGDLIKSYFLANGRWPSVGISVAVVVYERLCDLFGLITWCALGGFIARPDVPAFDTDPVHPLCQPDGGRPDDRSAFHLRSPGSARAMWRWSS